MPDVIPAPSDPNPSDPNPSDPNPSDPLPPRPWSLPDHPSLEWLRKQARQLQRRFAAADPQALALVAELDPSDAPAGSSPPAISLARAQRVLARAFGCTDWPALRAKLDTIATWSRSFDPLSDEQRADEDVADRFLRLACLDYATFDPSAPAAARALLTEHPEVATSSAATLAVCGRTAELAALLAADPAATSADTGPYRWSPLLYLCYSRLGGPGTGGVEDLAPAADGADVLGCAATLLARGADPDAGFLWQGMTSPFTALTGAFGGGERSEPPHPQGSAVARLLLQAGADPNDNQTLYNRMFTPANDFLEVLFEFGLGTERPSVWRDRLGAAAYPSPEEMVGEQLRSAAERGFTDRVALLLRHGVDPNTTGYHPILGDQNAYEVAVRTGHTVAAHLLAAAGGASDRLDQVDLLLSTLLAADEPAVRRRLERRPELLAEVLAQVPAAIRVAVAHRHDAAVPLLLELGFDVNARDRFGTTALHEAAFAGRTAVVDLLLAAGADRTLRDHRFDADPAGWAEHEGHQALADHLRR